MQTIENIHWRPVLIANFCKIDNRAICQKLTPPGSAKLDPPGAVQRSRSKQEFVQWVNSRNLYVPF
jgi:hypothetical protein